MQKKLTPRLIKKFDITNKIFKELADFESRHILFSIVNNPKSIQEISLELKIPLSTAYQKIQNLKKISLISVQPEFLENGKIVQIYQSHVKDVQIHLSNFEPKISLKKNPKVKL